ncbi:MAG: helix-turn-helix domain-containing protein [Nitrospirota bacterium]|nr:helix-turn-helix domain-containing protein [Nitrospirota bacterium]
MLSTVKQLSEKLQIKASTLYAWAATGKIPCRKLYRLIRFDSEAIDQWLRSFPEPESAHLPCFSGDKLSVGVDTIVARAKRQAYNSRHGETRPKPSPNGKEGE